MTSPLATLLRFPPRTRAAILASLTDAERAALAAEADGEPLAAFIARTTPAHAPIPPHLARLIAVLERAATTPGTLVLVSMPPRHGKSVTLHAALAWMVCRWPERLNAYVTYQSELARLASRRVRKLALAQGVRLADDAATLSDWRTTAEGGLAATGISSGLTGKGFDGLVVVDDPIAGREAAESLLQREQIWETFNSDAFSRLNPGGSIVVVATRWHHDDLIGRLEKQSDPTWEVINLPALDDDGAALWPARFDATTLRRIEAQIGPYAFASLYQGRPVPKGGTMFRVPARYELPTLAGAQLAIGIDPAGSADTRADFTAAVVLAVRHEWDERCEAALPHADVLEVLRAQLATDGAAAALYELQQRHQGAPLVIEASRDGKAIADALRRTDGRLRVLEVPIQGDKFTRSQPVATAWNQGRVRLPLRAPWLPEFVHETELFTGVADRHDDQVDALAYAWNHLAGAWQPRVEESAPIPVPPRYAY